MEHDQKFADFNRMIEQAKKDGVEAVMVHHPQVLGDDYRELVTNLDKLAAAKLALVIVPPDERQPA